MGSLQVDKEDRDGKSGIKQELLQMACKEGNGRMLSKESIALIRVDNLWFPSAPIPCFFYPLNLPELLDSKFQLIFALERVRGRSKKKRSLLSPAEADDLFKKKLGNDGA